MYLIAQQKQANNTSIILQLIHLYKNNWLQVEDQGQIGSCQGQALTECAEFCYGIETGKVVQFSRM